MRSAVIILVILALVAVAAFVTERWHPPARARRARVLAPRRHPARRPRSRPPITVEKCGCLRWAEIIDGKPVPTCRPCHEHASEPVLFAALEKEFGR